MFKTLLHQSFHMMGGIKNVTIYSVLFSMSILILQLIHYFVNCEPKKVFVT